MKKKLYLGITLIVFSIIGVSSSIPAQSRKPVVVPGKSFLPLRVLARPYSNLYDAPDGTIIEENVPVFQSYFVYTRPDVSVTSTDLSGWYEVGSDNRGTVLGWMKAKDVMEWKQTMCLAYTHPGGRNPVLMFEHLDPLRELLKASSESRTATANQFYQDIEAGKFSEDFPIISKEPEDYIDIVEQFYLLPILEHSPFEVQGVEGRLLKVAAATKEERGSGDMRTNPEAFSSNPEAAVLRNLQMDIMYVVDMTGSMQRYIDATLAVIKNMSLAMTRDAELSASVKFGLWGYRDSVKGSPGKPDTEFVTKNFTPALQQVNEFEETLASVRVDGGGDGPEDVFSGVDKAMRETAWTQGALHIIVLLGDAPSHKPGEDRNLSGQSASTLREFANPPNNFYVYALHIKARGESEYNDLTEQQFRTLSRNPGLETSSYWSVFSNDKNGFDAISKAIAGELVSLVEFAKKGDLAAITTAATASSSSSDSATGSVMKMGHAALVQWLGREKGTKAPPDVTAWITDKDLIDPDVQALDVRILINKNDLDSMKTVLQEIMTAGRRGIIGGEDFFTALQSIPSVASRAGDQIKSATTIADSGLLPEFMQDLPYQSRIMNMSNELWASWGVDQQEEFLNEIDAKIKLYAAIHDNPDGWIPLNEGDDPSEYVTPVSLESLP